MSEIRRVPGLVNFGITEEGKVVTNIYEKDKWEELETKLDSNGIPSVYFSCPEFDISFNVPRTVVDAWQLPTFDSAKIIHLDRNKLNCSPANLKCVTAKEHYAWMHGKQRISEGTKEKIREYAKLGMTAVQIAKVLGKDEETVKEVIG